VGRATVIVRAVEADEVPLLTPLWAEFASYSPGLVGPGASDVLPRVAEHIRASQAIVAAGGRPTYRLAVAEVDGEFVGFASLSVIDRGLLSTTSAVVIDAVHVADRRRRAGVGTALVREAAGFADEIGATDVLANVPPSNREVNRFFARYGFAPLVVRRTVPIAQLRRRLGVDLRLDPRDATVDLTPVQRSLRRRVLLTPRRTARP